MVQPYIKPMEGGERPPPHFRPGGRMAGHLVCDAGRRGMMAGSGYADGRAMAVGWELVGGVLGEC